MSPRLRPGFAQEAVLAAREQQRLGAVLDVQVEDLADEDLVVAEGVALLQTAVEVRDDPSISGAPVAPTRWSSLRKASRPAAGRES